MQVRDKRLHGTPYRRYDVFVHPHPTLGVRMDEWEHALYQRLPKLESEP